MLFLLRKLAEAVLLPIGFTAFFCLAGAAFRRRWMVVAGVLTLYLFSTALVENIFMRPLEHVYPTEPVASAPEADAIVVLSGGVVRGVNAEGVQFGEAGNRYFAGYDLAAANKAKLLVFTAAETGDAHGPNQGSIEREVAIAHGISPDRIVVTPPVLVTEDEARDVSKIPGVRSVLLVTSGFHMPRAAMLFRARGLEVFPFPTDQRSLGKFTIGPGSLIPTAAHLDRSEMALREYYGLAIYRTLLLLHPSSLRS